MEQLTLDEPPYVVAIDEAIVRGRGIRRRHATATSSLAAVATLAVIGAGVAMTQLHSAPDGSGVSAATAPDSGTPTPSAASITTGIPAASPTAVAAAASTATPSELAAQIKNAVAATEPGIDYSGWDVTSVLDGATSVDGNVNDGQGAARFYVTVMPASSPSKVYSNPCVDPEFVDGASCTWSALGADGSTLTLRGLSHDTGGYTQVMVDIWHPDGSAVLLEADNGSIDLETAPSALPSAAMVSKAGTGMLNITRATPVFTVDQLATLAKAIDTATRG